jgi:hypothetical protein
MSYSLKTHKEKTRNLICEHDMDAKRENKNTQKYVGSYNQKVDETDTQMEIYFGDKSRHAINKVYRWFKSIVPKSQWCTTLA